MPEVQTGMDASPEAVASYAEEAGKVDAARAELYDEATGGDAEGDNLILGKYRSVNDLAQAYQSLQSEYSRLKSNAPQQVEEQQADYQPQDTGYEDYEEEPAADALTPERAAELRTRIMEQAGGDQQYQRVAGWASQNLPPERVDSFNQALMAGDEGAILNQLKGLQYDFMMANGYEPKLSGGRAATSDVKAFTSEAQVVEAMNDPRYSGSNPDPAYIKEVERRIAVSNVFQAR